MLVYVIKWGGLVKYYLDDKTIHIFPSLLKYIAEGKEGKLYKYKDNALKIFHNKLYEKTMSSETCVELKKINTERILLPREMLLDRYGEFIGYTTKYIYNNKFIYDITKEKLVAELLELEKEINILSVHNILIDDWHINNLIYDGMIRFVDPGIYEYVPNMSINDIKKHNYMILKDFVFYELLKQRLMFEMYNYSSYLNEVYETYKNNICNFFEEKMYDCETINQYIKRLVKSDKNML